jgi:hypothetical protein
MDISGRRIRTARSLAVGFAACAAYTARPPTTRFPMAKPNYSYEKRQRELAKKKKQDEKAAKKREAREGNKPDQPDTPPQE